MCLGLTGVLPLSRLALGLDGTTITPTPDTAVGELLAIFPQLAACLAPSARLCR